MGDNVAYRGFRDLIVYQKSFSLSVDIFKASCAFPKHELYSLTDQLRRSSRSVAANIAEAWPKRRYSKHFTSTLVTSAGEATETEFWLDTALALGYLEKEQHDDLLERCHEIEKMLHSMIRQPEKFR